MSLETISQLADIGQFTVLLIILFSIWIASPKRITEVVQVLEKILAATNR